MFRKIFHPESRNPELLTKKVLFFTIGEGIYRGCKWF